MFLDFLKRASAIFYWKTRLKTEGFKTSKPGALQAQMCPPGPNPRSLAPSKTESSKPGTLQAQILEAWHLPGPNPRYRPQSSKPGAQPQIINEGSSNLVVFPCLIYNEGRPRYRVRVGPGTDGRRQQ
jgi:hypothetical protein